MKKRTLRQSMLFYGVIALLLPLLLLAVVTQRRILILLQNSLRYDMQTEIENADGMLNMVMEKYDAVLYDFCTDDAVVALVERINGNDEDVLDINSNYLRRQLSHVCNRNEGVQALTLVTSTGNVFFYDRYASSFVNTTWADKVSVPEVSQGAVYQAGGDVLLGDGNRTYMVQICRRLVDFQNIHRSIGTVILSIDQKLIWDAIQTKESSQMFLCDSGRIISARDETLIGKTLSQVDDKGRRVISRVNVKTGWRIYDYFSEREYHNAIFAQMSMGIVYSLGFILLILLVLFFVMNPVLKQVNILIQAMSLVEAGDLSAKVERVSYLPTELEQIVDGFNSMIYKINQLLVQVKKSAEEQKNAELSAMEAQIDPHFLYNTLDTINWKAIEREEYEISSMVGGLADILRYSIRNPGETVSIGQELYWLDQYVTLQKERLEQPLELVMDVSKKIREYRIHKLLLQPFVENAIKHGFSQKKEPCRLEIRMRLTEGQIYIQIRDNGKGISGEKLKRLNDQDGDPRCHVGIANVRKRLQLYYGEESSMYFESLEGVGTTVHLFVTAIGGGEQNRENHNC